MAFIMSSLEEVSRGCDGVLIVTVLVVEVIIMRGQRS